MCDYQRPERQIAQTVSLTCRMFSYFHGAKTTVQPRSHHKNEQQPATEQSLAGGSEVCVNNSIITAFQNEAEVNFH